MQDLNKKILMNKYYTHKTIIQTFFIILIEKLTKYY